MTPEGKSTTKEAVKMAHNNIRPATVTLGHGFVDNTTVPGCPMPRLGSKAGGGAVVQQL